MKRLLLVALASASLMLATASAQAHIPPDRKVDMPMVLTATVAIPNVSAEMPATLAPAMHYTISAEVGYQVDSATAPITSAEDASRNVLAPPNGREAGVIWQRSNQYRCAQGSRTPYPTLHPDPGRRALR